MFYAVFIVVAMTLLPKYSAGDQDRLHIRVHVHDRYHKHTHNQFLYKPVYEKYYVPIFDKKEPSRHKVSSHHDQWPHGTTNIEQVAGRNLNSSEDSIEDYRWPMPLKWNSTTLKSEDVGAASYIVHHPVHPFSTVHPIQTVRPMEKSYTGRPVSYGIDSAHNKRQLGLEDYYYNQNRFVDDPYANSSEEEVDEDAYNKSSEERGRKKPKRKGPKPPKRVLFRPVSDSVIRNRVKSIQKSKRNSQVRPSVFSFTVPN